MSYDIPSENNMIHARCVGDGYTAYNKFTHWCVCIYNILVEVGKNVFECVHKVIPNNMSSLQWPIERPQHARVRRCRTISNYPKLNNINIYIREFSRAFAEEL